MNSLQQKLQGRRGASILLALMFFLICAAIGAIVLTAAFSNAGRMSHMRDDQTAHLSVSSAAKLVRAELADMQFVGEYAEVTDEYTGVVDTITDTFALDTTVSAATSLTDLVKEMAKDIYDGTASAPITGTFTITPNSTVMELKPVEVALTMSTTYSLTAELSIANDLRYAMTLTVPANTNKQQPVNEWKDVPVLDPMTLIEEIHIMHYVTKTTTITFGAADKITISKTGGS